jgi:hypothetical protein
MLKLHKLTFALILIIGNITWSYAQNNYVVIYREYLEMNGSLKEFIKSSPDLTNFSGDTSLVSRALSNIPFYVKVERQITVVGNENYLEISSITISSQTPPGMDFSLQQEGKTLVDLKNRLIFDDKTKKITKLKPIVLENKLKNKEKCKALKINDSGEEKEIIFCPEVPAFIFPYSFLCFSKNKYGFSNYYSKDLKIELVSVKEADKKIDYKDFFEPYLKIDISKE